MKVNKMVMIILFKHTEETFLFTTGERGGGGGGGMCNVLPVFQSTRKNCRQDSEDYLNSGHSLL